jgi:hypothetical protein
MTNLDIRQPLLVGTPSTAPSLENGSIDSHKYNNNNNNINGIANKQMESKKDPEMIKLPQKKITIVEEKETKSRFILEVRKGKTKNLKKFL